jgi:flagellin
MVVQHNITSMNANRQLGMVTNNLQKSTEKLSSGYRINRAADDAAGLSKKSGSWSSESF